MRKITQIAVVEDESVIQGCLTALCNDGTVWFFQRGEWLKLPQDIPQDGFDPSTTNV